MAFIITDSHYVQHLTGVGHPESPARVPAIHRALITAGLQTRQNTLKPRAATEAEILLCHSKSYFDLVKREVGIAKQEQICTMLSTGDVVISPQALDVALLAAGGVLTAVDAVMNQEKSSAFCVVRPPGHHACTSIGMGFCLFNNVAIGARYAQRTYGIERVLIVDWDVHHGNGTQEIFYNDPSVFYFSTHQQGIYPGTGAAGERGVGNILNCPIAPGNNSRLEVFSAFNSQLLPAMEKFSPQLVMISCGFDGHEDDPLGNFNLTSQEFGDLTKIVKDIAEKYAEGRMISVLEGGYNLEAIAEAAVVHCRELSVMDEK